MIEREYSQDSLSKEIKSVLAQSERNRFSIVSPSSLHRLGKRMIGGLIRCDVSPDELDNILKTVFDKNSG